MNLYIKFNQAYGNSVSLQSLLRLIEKCLRVVKLNQDGVDYISSTEHKVRKDELKSTVYFKERF